MDKYQPIENYGVIGDLNTVALVGMNGSIDFMSFPHFDSPTIFAALLDDEKGGRFCIAPILDHPQRRQLYLPDTNVLLTRFLSDDGVAEISDCMPIQEMGHAHDVIRRVKTVRGEIRFRMVCQPRFDYGRVTHRVETCDDCILFVSEGIPSLTLRLRSTVPLRIEAGAAIAEFTLPAGESAAFVLEQASADESQSPSKSPDYVSVAFKETVNFWRQWVSRSRYQGRWRETRQSLGADVEAAHLRALWLHGRRADVRTAGTHRRRAQLGLPLQLDSRLFVHSLRAHAAGIHATKPPRSCAGSKIAANICDPMVRCNSCIASTAARTCRN